MKLAFAGLYKITLANLPLGQTWTYLGVWFVCLSASVYTSQCCMIGENGPFDTRQTLFVSVNYSNL